MGLTGMAEPIVTLAEAGAFARIETGEEEALVAGLIRTASALCEAFIGQVVIARQFTETVAASPRWQRLSSRPVRSIDTVSASVGGEPLIADAYGADIDSSGDGWVRVADPSVLGVVVVSGTAGIAPTENEVPEPIRQGVLRLVAHFFAARDGWDRCSSWSSGRARGSFGSRRLSPCSTICRPAGRLPSLARG
jgi:uncharacterized phiE125 gp8 family phage protein